MCHVDSSEQSSRELRLRAVVTEGKEGTWALGLENLKWRRRGTGGRGARGCRAE